MFLLIAEYQTYITLKLHFLKDLNVNQIIEKTLRRVIKTYLQRFDNCQALRERTYNLPKYWYIYMFLQTCMPWQLTNTGTGLITEGPPAVYCSALACVYLCAFMICVFLCGVVAEDCVSGWVSSCKFLHAYYHNMQSSAAFTLLCVGVFHHMN